VEPAKIAPQCTFAHFSWA